MTHVPRNDELPPPPTDVDGAGMTREGVEAQLCRRNFFGLAGKSLVVATVGATGAGLTNPRLAEAQPDDEPTDPGQPPTPEERELIKAQTNHLNEESDLFRKQREQIEKALNPPSFFDGAAKFIGEVATPLGLMGGLIGGVAVGTVGVTRYLKDKRESREVQEEAMRVEEDGRYAAALDKIGDTIREVSVNEADRRLKRVNYTSLHLAYAQLEAFTGKERFSGQVFHVTTTLLRDRAKALIKMPPLRIEERLNADRELVRLLVMVAPNLPREDAEGNSALPNAVGISLNGMRFLRDPLEALNLEGSYLQRLMITGSLARSSFRLAHLDGATFGEPDGVCDLRGTDLSRAHLKGASFAHVLIDKHTKFGAGQEGNPTATFGNVTFDDTLTKEEVEDKIGAAQDVIKTWQQKHPEPSARPQRALTRLARLITS